MLRKLSHKICYSAISLFRLLLRSPRDFCIKKVFGNLTVYGSLSPPSYEATRILEARGMMVFSHDCGTCRWSLAKIVDPIQGYDRGTIGPEGSANGSSRWKRQWCSASLSSEETKSTSHHWPTCLTHYTFFRPLVFLPLFLPAQRNQQQWGHGVKRQAR